jgi:hypothetical protein
MWNAERRAKGIGHGAKEQGLRIYLRFQVSGFGCQQKEEEEQTTEGGKKKFRR